ncbi:MAG TPA: M20/M25/M40 family metallo-hydrolase [Gemmatimonadaceae bacterium]|nr:M20/M25/M40 family metallo-hydrolase [Gemmatimonadaceae bacterium]
MRTRLLISFFAVLAALLLSAPTLAAQAAGPEPVRPVNWNAIQDETVRLMQEYLRINTTNPPGNELAGALWLKGVLEREGFEVQILDTTELGKGRANLYTRLRGNGSKKAIALVHHIDVVPSTESYWKVPPFSGEIRDGFIYGRGALDMKGEGIAHLMAMIALKRSGVPLTRDIVYIANSDEELGSTGAIVFVEKHADLLKDVEYVITEGGDNLVEDGKLKYWGIGVAEKRTFWQKVTVKGTPSHGSRPTKQNPVPKLVRALAKIADYETPLHVTPGVQKFFRDISPGYSGEQRRWLADVSTAVQSSRARAWLTRDTYWNAILRNTITLTGLEGSNKTNVIPPEATAKIDIRLLPDQNPAQVLATLKRIVNDTSVHFENELAPKTPLESPASGPLFEAIERAAKERDPNAIVTTPMLTGATDRPTYQRLGIKAYGLDPFQTEASVGQEGVHGNNERIRVEDAGAGVRFLYDILRYAQ